MGKKGLYALSGVVGFVLLVGSYIAPKLMLGAEIQGEGESVSITKYQKDLRELKERGNDNLDKFGDRYAITPSNVFDNNIIRQIPELDENGKPVHKTQQTNK